VEILKQDQYVPLPVEKQILIIFAATQGYLDDLPVKSLTRFEAELYKYVEQKHSKLLTDILERKALDDDLKARIKKGIEAFKKRFAVEEGKSGEAEEAFEREEEEEAPPPPPVKKTKKAKKG
jgi:F-type H+/Na+-transporting ATPase subunit alpha